MKFVWRVLMTAIMRGSKNAFAGKITKEHANKN